MYKTLFKHEDIKKWVESKKGMPAIIEARDAGSDKAGLRIDFPGDKSEALLSRAKPAKEVSWEKFFEIFDQQKLAFVVDTQGRGGDMSLMYRFIKRSNLNDAEQTDDQVKGREFADELGAKEVIPGDNPQLGQVDNRILPSLRGATGNKSLTNEASPDEEDVQWYKSDSADPASDDDVMEVVKEVGLHPDKTQDDD